MQLKQALGKCQTFFYFKKKRLLVVVEGRGGGKGKKCAISRAREYALIGYVDGMGLAVYNGASSGILGGSTRKYFLSRQCFYSFSPNVLTCVQC